MIDLDDPTIKAFLKGKYAVSVQLHVKPGGLPRYTAMARHVATRRHVQGWGPTAAEAVEDLRRRADVSVRLAPTQS